MQSVTKVRPAVFVCNNPSFLNLSTKAWL